MMQASSIGSPIGKIFIDETSRRTWSGCGTPRRSPSCFDAPYIRLFSFFIRGRRRIRPTTATR